MSRYMVVLEKWHWLIYPAVLALAVLSYQPVKGVMVSQETSFTVIVSGITLNMILLYGLWGVLIDKVMRGKPRWMGWTVFFAGLVALTLILKFVGGLETRF